MAVTESIDQGKLEQFVGNAIGELGAIASGAMVYIGDRLGLYRALGETGPSTAAELADQTGLALPYLKAWLQNQGASGFIRYDAATERFSLSPEQRIALTDEDSPFFIAGAFQLFFSAMGAVNRISDNFRTGQGMAWGEHDPGLFAGTERFFKPGYVGNLVGSWIPALDGVSEKLSSGATVADVGCGHGVTTTLMARAFPASRFLGSDSHAPSIERARRLANEDGLAGRTEFVVAHAHEAPGEGYAFVTMFDCLHDMSNPVGALRRAYEMLSDDGTLMLVEPMAGERVEDNFTPVGRLASAASAMVCTPNALAGGGEPLGTLVPESRLRQLLTQAGFGRVRRAAETPVNRVYEARK
ncbi:MAG: class I SAM-dependent methyltransferase [Chloroflexota bacterium]